MPEIDPNVTLDKKPISPEEWEICLRTLESAIGDRRRLLTLDAAERRRLMEAAGRLSRPDKSDLTRLAKARRNERKRVKRTQERQLRSRSQIRLMRKVPVYVPPALLPGDQRQSRGTLDDPRSCYVCKAPYREIHFFYDTMCLDCGDFNYAKRFQSHSLGGKVALITGARVKIGYQAALMMLRAGATVLVSTRFPKDSALRFSNEADFASWKDRLRIHGTDLRHPGSVERFADFIDANYSRLDILINNAAQTVRRPSGFYRHLEENENRPTDSFSQEVQQLLGERENWLRFAHGKISASTSIAAPEIPKALAGVTHPHLPSLLPWSQEDLEATKEFFPERKYDADQQQVDLRKINSWRLRLGEVGTPELLEVQLVNSIAPFILCGRLRQLMARSGTGESHIVNVSAMEGKFSRLTKTDKHPHTNMAKAALNMMTLTSAQDFAQDGIYMNAVDTGWVTDEDPIEISTRKQEELGFEPPLDIVDGAARICDPFFSGLATKQHAWGIFFKDYRPTPW